ncbi:histidine kinase [Amycolatopsis sp. NPDC049868]|uniref:histidine kinase n=1 Tax=Amycolatopsis sp. NPDC049868 TaxID=3363934 RepID=UPI0037A8C8BB
MFSWLSGEFMVLPAWVERWRGLYRHRPVIADSVLAVAFVLGHVAVSAAWWGLAMPAGRRVWLPELPAIWQLVMLGLTLALLAVRRRYPVTVLFALLTAYVLAVDVLNGVSAFPFIAVLITMYEVATSCSRRVMVVALAGVVVMLVLGVLWQAYLVNRAGQPVATTAFAWALIVVVIEQVTMSSTAVAFGVAVRTSRGRARELQEKTAELRRAQEQLAAKAVLEERQAIARELHDVVARGLGVIKVQAGVALALPEQREDLLRVIEDVARDAVLDMGRMLATLRSLQAGNEPGPRPGLARLDDLVATMRRSGLPVDEPVRVTPRPLAPGHDMAAYRITQEALTNVLKHAGRVRTTVRLDYRPEVLLIDVVNEAGEQRDPPPSTGNGLLGMRERVLLYGGSLEAGPTPDGGFRVRAQLATGNIDSGAAGKGGDR